MSETEKCEDENGTHHADKFIKNMECKVEKVTPWQLFDARQVEGAAFSQQVSVGGKKSANCLSTKSCVFVSKCRRRIKYKWRTLSKATVSWPDIYKR